VSTLSAQEAVLLGSGVEVGDFSSRHYALSQPWEVLSILSRSIERLEDGDDYQSTICEINARGLRSLACFEMERPTGQTWKR